MIFHSNIEINRLGKEHRRLYQFNIPTMFYIKYLCISFIQHSFCCVQWVTLNIFQVQWISAYTQTIQIPEEAVLFTIHRAEY